MALINGEAHSWDNIQVRLFGRTVQGISAISYTDEQEITMNPGAGNKPVSYSKGSIQFSGTITLESKEVQAISDSATVDRLQDIPPFPINVAFISASTGLMSNHKLCSCLFKNNGRSASTGDTQVNVELELAIGDIEWS